MRVRQIDASERERFDAYISQANGDVLQSYEWGEVKAKTGWRPLRLVAEDGERIRAAITVLVRKVPLFDRTIFYAPRGPVIDFQDAEAFDALIAELRRLARAQRAVFLKIDPDVPAGDRETASFLASRGFVSSSGEEKNFEGVQPRFVFRLPLDGSLDEIMARFSSKTRYNIRLAERRGVNARVGTRDDLPAFYRLLEETAARDRFLIRSYDYFVDIWDNLVQRGLARLFVAEYEGEMIAGTLAFIMGNKAWYVYGASGNRHRNVMPNHLLQWTMINWAVGEGCTLYDFRGISGDMNPDNPLYGLYRFKKGFGGEVTEFIGEFDLPFAPLFYRLWNVAEPAYRRARAWFKAARRG